MDLSFGLENLVFSGKTDGSEHIEVLIEFFDDNDQLLHREHVSRQYSALRDAPVEEVEAPTGALFRWTGDYIQPLNQNKYEIFVFSTKDAHEAEKRKSMLDEAALQVGSQEVAGVVRPPLGKSEWYGVVIGLVKPTGQIQFTFDEQHSGSVCRWALEARENEVVSRLIGHDYYRYEMEPRLPGAPKFIPCRDL